MNGLLLQPSVFHSLTPLAEKPAEASLASIRATIAAIAHFNLQSRCYFGKDMQMKRLLCIVFLGHFYLL